MTNTYLTYQRIMLVERRRQLLIDTKTIEEGTEIRLYVHVDYLTSIYNFHKY